MPDVRTVPGAPDDVRRLPRGATAAQLRAAAGKLARELASPASVDLSGLTGNRLAAAVEGLLLDRSNPKWRSRYFAEKFDNSSYFKRK